MNGSVLRPTLASFRYQVRFNATSITSILIFIFTPIIFGSVATLFFSAYNARQLSTQAILGSAIIAIWSTSLMLSSITLSNERWSGVVELLLATPSRLAAIMFGKLLANSCQGIGAALLSVAFVSIISRTMIHVENPLLLGGSALLAILAIGSLAFAWSPILFVSQNATSVFFMLDTGLTFVSALFYPLSVLPSWLQPIARVSPLYWASQALVGSTSSSTPISHVMHAWGAMAILALVLAGIGLIGFTLLERRLRRTGELSTF